jgi:hypothetical protein
MMSGSEIAETTRAHGRAVGRAIKIGGAAEARGGQHAL